MTFDAKTSAAWAKLEAFHAHLDGCEQCRNAPPYGLCAIGYTKLANFILADEPQGDLSLSRTPEVGTEANGAQIDQ